jgi:hypothetical protein
VAQGGLDSWIAQALRILDMPQSLAPGVKKIIMAESGGNPHAINLTDSNARRGTPSQGLMQTIPSTFRHYVAPEVAGRPITDPVANITAGINYMVENYGINTVAAGGRSKRVGQLHRLLSRFQGQHRDHAAGSRPRGMAGAGHVRRRLPDRRAAGSPRRAASSFDGVDAVVGDAGDPQAASGDRTARWRTSCRCWTAQRASGSTRPRPATSPSSPAVGWSARRWPG